MATLPEKTRWRQWADHLRQNMMSELTSQVTRSVATIMEETGTSKSTSQLRSQRFWSACQSGKPPHDTLVSAGFEVDFEPNADGEIDVVTLRLNNTWQSILQRVLDRRVN